MHELQITESILDIAMKHIKNENIEMIKAIHLKIGELSDLEDEWIQHYFDYLSKGTVAEGAKLIIERSPIIMKCNDCDNEYGTSQENFMNGICPKCKNRDCSLVSGREYLIKHMEVI